MAVTKKSLYRVMDANFNRTKEGLRVCEDVCRYVLDQPSLTGEYKKLRHAVTEAIKLLDIKGLIAARDIDGDVGRGTICSEEKRNQVADIFYANSQRVKESLRVLEEFAKLMNVKAAALLKTARYQSYALEQKALKVL